MFRQWSYAPSFMPFWPWHNFLQQWNYYSVREITIPFMPSGKTEEKTKAPMSLKRMVGGGIRWWLQMHVYKWVVILSSQTDLTPGSIISQERPIGELGPIGFLLHVSKCMHFPSRSLQRMCKLVNCQKSQSFSFYCIVFLRGTKREGGKVAVKSTHFTVQKLINSLQNDLKQQSRTLCTSQCKRLIWKVKELGSGWFMASLFTFILTTALQLEPEVMEGNKES